MEFLVWFVAGAVFYATVGEWAVRALAHALVKHR